MNEAINTAVTLLGVGMITVFLVLLFVIIVGNLLISFVNKFIPPSTEIKRTSTEISPSKVAAITTAIEVFTKGKGKITSISKIK